MSHKRLNRLLAKRKAGAPVFAALGDPTRLMLVAKLSGGEPLSIAELTKGAGLTRQAITKHLRVLQGAGLVRGVSAGRESRFAFVPEPLETLQEYLDLVLRQWDKAPERLKSLVEG
jgi:DNA-binding transcriptional ArsR family regulator